MLICKQNPIRAPTANGHQSPHTSPYVDSSSLWRRENTDGAHWRKPMGPGLQSLSVSREAVPNLKDCIRVATDRDKGFQICE